eukprot:703507-Rhodomonas_salina.2
MNPGRREICMRICRRGWNRPQTVLVVDWYCQSDQQRLARPGPLYHCRLGSGYPGNCRTRRVPQGWYSPRYLSEGTGYLVLTKVPWYWRVM